jgi:nitroimidazol reductase NimA-like FMN-containing flavoprotein (pyridoxamine 5'-phosphate oxidase superfamily)
MHSSEPIIMDSSEPRSDMQGERPMLAARKGLRTRVPRTVTLTHRQCEKLLARNHVGRLAYTFRDAVDIVPLHYAYADGWIYIRTAPGQKLAKLRHHRWVAFEVDEIFGMFDWSSVVVHGAVYLLDPDAVVTETWDSAVRAIQRKFPDAFTDRDPVPFRSAVFRIHIDVMTGRRTTPAPR